MMLVLSTACVGDVGGVDASAPPTPGSITGISTADASVPFGQTPPASVELAAAVVGTGVVDTSVTWELDPGADGCGTLGASVTQSGLFTAPTSPLTSIGGTCKVVAKAVADPSKTGISTVTITAPTTGTPSIPSGVVPAFLGAEGGGALAKGGRGGVVYEVTNLNDSGTGSLRACVERTGPRTCVFKTAGVINLSGSMRVTSPYLTVAGQTAPGDGIALNMATHAGNQRVFSIDAGGHDIVIRYLRIWGDYVTNINPSNYTGTFGVMVWGNAHHVVVDHCTLLWHSGEGLGIWGDGTASTDGRVTFQWNLVGENTMGSTGSPQSTAALTANSSYDGTRMPDVDLHHNVLVSADHRVPELNGSGRLVNNLIYNWARATIVDSGGGQSAYDIIGNHWKPGPMSPATNYREVMFNRGVASVYMANNRSDWNLSGRGTVSETASDGGWSLLTGTSSVYQGSASTTPAPSAYRRSPWARLPSPGIDITADVISGSSLVTMLTGDGRVGMARRLDCSGNWVNVSDSARDRILAYVVAGAGPSAPPSSQTSLGPLPSLASGTPCADVDHDGIPDAYEQAACGSSTCLDAKAVQADGYTNLEHYLNGR